MIEVTIQGVSAMLQHRFTGVEEALSPVKRKSGSLEKEHLLEWTKTMYARDGHLVIPAIHLEQCMVSAAVNFRIKGAGRKTYKDAFLGGVIVIEPIIPITRNGAIIPAPTEEDAKYNQYDEPVYIDLRPVRVQRARVPRARVCINAGWEAKFSINVIDEQISAEVVEAVLEFGGRQKGIGDYRPKFGRFEIVSLAEVE